MKKNFFPFALIAATALVACSLTAPQLADPIIENPVVVIIPDRNSSADKFCNVEQVDGKEMLHLQMTNIGPIPYGGGAELRVDFPGFPSPPIQTLPVMPEPHVDSQGTFNKVADFFFEIPPGCFNSDCVFNISWANQPKVRGVCLG